MFNIGVGEITVIVIAALILLGPERLPEAARTLGKFYREFRRQTDEVRGVVLREFYKMEREAEALEAPVKPKAPTVPAPVETVSNGQTISILPAQGAVARGGPKPVEPAPVAVEAQVSAPAEPAPVAPVAAAETAAKETGA